MSINPIRKLEGTALDVPVAGNRDSADTIYLASRRKSEYTLRRVLSRRIKRSKSAAAITLVEIIVSMVVLIVAILGAMGFRYYCSLDARKADLQVTAGRFGLLLLENWKASGGAVDYDPVAEFGPDFAEFGSDLVIISVGTSADGEFPVQGIYKITDGHIDYYAVLSYKDLIPAAVKILNVEVAWGGPNTAQSVRLTTYALY